MNLQGKLCYQFFSLFCFALNILQNEAGIHCLFICLFLCLKILIWVSLYMDQGSASYHRSQKDQTFAFLKTRQLEFKEVIYTWPIDSTKGLSSGTNNGRKQRDSLDSPLEWGHLMKSALMLVVISVWWQAAASL